jgi:hypothetical protein
MSYPQIIIWTALPNGFSKDGSKLKLSVVVSPRLSPLPLPETTLDKFPDFLDTQANPPRYWPARVRDEIKFKVEFTSVGGFAHTFEPNEVAITTDPPPEPSVWGALFKPATLIRPRQFRDFRGRNIRSFPVSHVMSFLKEQYQQIATNPVWATDEPPLVSILAAPGRFGWIRLFKTPTKPAGRSYLDRHRVENARTQLQYHIQSLVQERVSKRGLSLASAVINGVIQDLTSLIRDTDPLIAGLGDWNNALVDEVLVDHLIRLHQALATYHAVSNPSPNPPRDFLQARLFHRPLGEKPKALARFRLSERSLENLRTEGVPAEVLGKLEDIKNQWLTGKEQLYGRLQRTIEDEDTIKYGPLIVKHAERVPLDTPKVDFHQILSSLAKYPKIMRRLGLVIDLETPIPPGVPPLFSGQVRVDPQWSPMPPIGFPIPPMPPEVRRNEVNRTPRTKFVLSVGSRKFLPQDAGDINNGMLALNGVTSQYDLVQVDVDGAAIKAMAFANTLSRLNSDTYKTTDTPDSATLPSLRSGGISVIRKNRALKLAEQFNNPDANDVATNATILSGDGTSASLSAQHLTSGYRVDVWDDLSQDWHSLCWRHGTYHFLDGDITEPYKDEGWVSAAATSAADGSSSDLYLHEALVRWDGWSLCVPRPGKTIGTDDEVLNYHEKSGQELVEENDLKLRAKFLPIPRSLPPLRLGRTYKLRIRAVDLAGNSIDFETANALMGPENEKEVKYLRFEPVSSPVVVPRSALKPEWTPGESLEHLVIRSNYNKTAEEYAAIFAGITGNPDYKNYTERHIAPPKTSQLLAEQHGMFDGDAGMKFDISTYNQIKARDIWSFEAYHDELDARYIPDPIARGASLSFRYVGKEGIKTLPPMIPHFYPDSTKWPEAIPFRIKIEEAPEGQLEPGRKFEPTERLLTVYFPKAEVVRVRLSSYLREGLLGLKNLEFMGIWQWIKDKNPANLDQLQNLALDGHHWMLTPYRELVLGHAVQQPLKVPKLQLKQVADRNRGETFASPLSYDLPGKRLEMHEVHGKSTVKVDVLAEWQEPIDALADEVPRDGRLWGQPMISGKAHVFEVPVQLDGLLVSAGGGNVQYDEISQKLIFMHLPRHEFGDTKYRKVRYKAVATTRFAEHFRPRVADEQVILTGIDVRQLAHAGVVEGSEVVASSDRKVTFVRGADYTMDYSNSKIARIDAGAIASGETVLMSYTYHPQVTEEVTLTGTTTQELTHTALAEKLEIVTTPDGGVTYHRNADYTVDYPNGKIARIEGGGIENGATIRVSYPLPFTRESEWVTIDIPNSARPAAPKILYVIPTFGWEKPQPQSGKPIVSKRLGGGLRIYMERSWYSSGDGELLGVVLASSLDDYKDDRLKPCITQWGADPLWQLQLTPDMPLSEHFTRRVSDATASGLALEEMEVTGKTVSVVGHEVGYDKDRQLWYCDIDIDFGPAYSAYYPFVRLALARYQPNSITKAHLSRVVLADFIQLAPNRTASLVFKDPTHLTISVSGPIGSGKLGRNEIEVSVEERDPQIEGDLGWVPTKEKPIRQSTHQHGAGVIWLGEITLPKPRGSQRFRLVIKEHELYYEGIEEDPQNKKQRLVYADALEI